MEERMYIPWLSIQVRKFLVKLTFPSSVKTFNRIEIKIFFLSFFLFYFFFLTFFFSFFFQIMLTKQEKSARDLIYHNRRVGKKRKLINLMRLEIRLVDTCFLCFLTYCYYPNQVSCIDVSHERYKHAKSGHCHWGYKGKRCQTRE